MPAKKRGRETKALLDLFTANKRQKTDDKRNNVSEEEIKNTEEEAEQKTNNTEEEEADQKTKQFEASLKMATDDKIYWEYMCFIKQLPLTLPPSIRKIWIKK